MPEEKIKHIKKLEKLPESFDSISEAAAFWDSHDSADYEEMMTDVEFEVEIKRHIYLEII